MRRFGRLVALAGLLLIALTTLIPLPTQAAAAAATPLWCLLCGEYGGLDVVLNVLLFIPLALGLRLLGLPAKVVLATGVAISIAIELLQLAVIPGRDASLSDLLTNTLGSGLGAALGSRLVYLLNPWPRLAIRLALSAGAVWFALQAGAALLLQPWVPRQPVRGAWGRVLPGRPPFGGRVTSAFVSGSPVPSGFVLPDSQFSGRLEGDAIHIELELVSGSRVADWSPVFELLGSHGPVLAVAALGPDLIFQPPARAYALRLRRPALRLPGALSPSPGTPLRVAAGEEGDTLWGRWSWSETRDQRVRVLSPSWGWSMLVPFDYAYGPEVHLLTAFWIAGWLLPIGYWAARSPVSSYSTTAGLALLLVAGLGLIPTVAGYPPVHWSEWLAGATGLATGWASSRAAAYF
jgi:hypothetical protein